MRQEMTIGEKYKPAMEIADQTEADKYFEECVQHSIAAGYTRERAEEIERQNLGYFAGYYNGATQERVERLFRCVHPIFGSSTQATVHTVSSLAKEQRRTHAK